MTRLAGSIPRERRKQRIAYRLAEELRRLALLLPVSGFSEVIDRRMARLKRIINYYRVNK